MDYINIWGIAALAGVACLGFFFLLTRRVSSLFVRTLLRCLGAVWILLPAPVPNYPGNYAPAFVVWVFEGVLQSDGEPLLSIQILLWSSLAVVGLVVFWYLIFGRHQKATRVQEQDAQAAAPPQQQPQQQPLQQPQPQRTKRVTEPSVTG